MKPVCHILLVLSTGLIWLVHFNNEATPGLASGFSPAAELPTPRNLRPLAPEIAPVTGRQLALTADTANVTASIAAPESESLGEPTTLPIANAASAAPATTATATQTEQSASAASTKRYN